MAKYTGKGYKIQTSRYKNDIQQRTLSLKVEELAFIHNHLTCLNLRSQRKTVWCRGFQRTLYRAG